MKAVIIRGSPNQAAQAAAEREIELSGSVGSGQNTVATTEASREVLMAWYGEDRRVPLKVGTLIFWSESPDYPFNLDL